MQVMAKFFSSDTRASAIRTLLRSGIVLLTAFGLKLSAEQVASIQAAVEAVLQAGRSWYGKGE